MVKMYPFGHVSELSVKIWQNLILVVYSNIFVMCYDNVDAAIRFIYDLVREPLACSNVKNKVRIDRQTLFLTFKSPLRVILHFQEPQRSGASSF